MKYIFFSYVSKGARQVCGNLQKAEASGDVGKSEIDDLSWICDAPVIDVDEKVDCSLPKVDDCLKILAGFVIQDNLVGDCLSR